MAFFKILSDNPADFQDEPIDMDCMNEEEEEDLIELVLDTGEILTIPILWLIDEARKNGFYSHIGMVTH